jgi:hypothetical protein
MKAVVLRVIGRDPFLGVVLDWIEGLPRQVDAYEHQVAHMASSAGSLSIVERRWVRSTVAVARRRPGDTADA